MPRQIVRSSITAGQLTPRAGVGSNFVRPSQSVLPGDEALDLSPLINATNRLAQEASKSAKIQDEKANEETATRATAFAQANPSAAEGIEKFIASRRGENDTPEERLAIFDAAFAWARDQELIPDVAEPRWQRAFIQQMAQDDASAIQAELAGRLDVFSQLRGEDSEGGTGPDAEAIMAEVFGKYEDNVSFQSEGGQAVLNQLRPRIEEQFRGQAREATKQAKRTEKRAQDTTRATYGFSDGVDTYSGVIDLFVEIPDDPDGTITQGRIDELERTGAELFRTGVVGVRALMVDQAVIQAEVTARTDPKAAADGLALLRRIPSGPKREDGSRLTIGSDAVSRGKILTALQEIRERADDEEVKRFTQIDRASATGRRLAVSRFAAVGAEARRSGDPARPAIQKAFDEMIVSEDILTLYGGKIPDYVRDIMISVKEQTITNAETAPDTSNTTTLAAIRNHVGDAETKRAMIALHAADLSAEDTARLTAEYDTDTLLDETRRTPQYAAYVSEPLSVDLSDPLVTTGALQVFNQSRSTAEIQIHTDIRRLHDTVPDTNIDEAVTTYLTTTAAEIVRGVQSDYAELTDGANSLRAGFEERLNNGDLEGAAEQLKVIREERQISPQGISALQRTYQSAEQQGRNETIQAANGGIRKAQGTVMSLFNLGSPDASVAEKSAIAGRAINLSAEIGRRLTRGLPAALRGVRASERPAAQDAFIEETLQAFIEENRATPSVTSLDTPEDVKVQGSHDLSMENLNSLRNPANGGLRQLRVETKALLTDTAPFQLRQRLIAADNGFGIGRTMDSILEQTAQVAAIASWNSGDPDAVFSESTGSLYIPFEDVMAGESVVEHTFSRTQLQGLLGRRIPVFNGFPDTGHEELREDFAAAGWSMDSFEFSSDNPLVPKKVTGVVATRTFDRTGQAYYPHETLFFKNKAKEDAVYAGSKDVLKEFLQKVGAWEPGLGTTFEQAAARFKVSQQTARTAIRTQRIRTTQGTE
jgi:hypothetical protein